MTAGRAASQDRSRQPVVIRRVQPSDRDALIEFYSGLSEASRYARFLGFTHGVDDQTARSFCTHDHMHQEGFVALVPGDGSRLVGHLCLEPAGERKLELAIAVADAYQGRGVGRRLIEAAIEWRRPITCWPSLPAPSPTTPGSCGCSIRRPIPSTWHPPTVASSTWSFRWCPNCCRPGQCRAGGVAREPAWAASPSSAPVGQPLLPCRLARYAAACARRWRLSFERIELT